MPLSISLGTVDMGLLGRWFRAAPVRPLPKIVLFTVPTEDVEVQDQHRAPGCTCPLVPRWIIANTIDKLRQAHVAVIVLDLIFDRPCPVHDKALSEAMTRANNVVVATKVLTRGKGLNLVPPPDSIHGYRVAASPAVYDPFSDVMAVETLQGANFQAVETPEGQLTIVSDYRLPLGLAAWCVMNGEDVNNVSIPSSQEVRVGTLTMPVIEEVPLNLLAPLFPQRGLQEGAHALPIRWCGPRNTFKSIAIADLLAGAVPTEDLRGCVAIVGDAQERPKNTLVGAMSGPEVQANVVATILGEHWFRPISPGGHWIIIFLAALVAAVGMTLLPGAGGVAVAIGVALVVTLVGRALVASDRWLLVGPVLVGVSISATSAMVADRLKGHRARRWMAREIELRDEVTSEVAHDMRGHLAALAQTMDLVLRRLSGYSEQAVDPRALDVLRRQLRALEHEVSTLMDADPERKLHARRAPVEMMDLVRSTAEDVQASTHGHTLRVSGTPATVAGDRTLLARAIWNLLNNAVKYSPHGGEIRAQVDSTESMVSVSVSDDGIGIRAEDMPKLFTRFGRAVPEGISIPGTGLGLYSVQRTAQAHHGRVTVESKVNVGTTFTLWLPAERPLSEAAEHDQYPNLA
jgi:signal transduction histidine kinase